MIPMHANDTVAKPQHANTYYPFLLSPTDHPYRPDIHLSSLALFSLQACVPEYCIRLNAADELYRPMIIHVLH